MATVVSTTNTNSLTIGASGNDRLVLAIGTKSGTFDSTVTFNGVAPTGSLLDEPSTSQSAIYYWLDADLPVSAGTYTYADNDVLKEFLLYATGVTQAAPSQTLVNTDLTVGGGAGSETERLLTLTSGTSDDLRVFAMRNAGTVGTDLSGMTYVDSGNANSITGYTQTTNVVGFKASAAPSSAVAMLFPAAAAPSNTTINVDIPLHINLKWDTTHQLAVTHDGGTTTLDGVTLSTPTGWETVTYSGSLPAGDSFASLAATDATLGGGGYTMQAGDILAWETQTGLTVDVNTTPVVNPAATRTGSYKIWNEVGQTWTNVSTFTINDLGLNVGSTIPVDDRVTFQAMVGYLITQGYQGAGNETIQKWLIAEGISKKSFNEMLRDYLTGLGYNGTLPEQLRDWRNG